VRGGGCLRYELGNALLRGLKLIGVSRFKPPSASTDPLSQPFCHLGVPRPLSSVENACNSHPKPRNGSNWVLACLISAPMTCTSGTFIREIYHVQHTGVLQVLLKLLFVNAIQRLLTSNIVWLWVALKISTFTLTLQLSAWDEDTTKQPRAS
jgi:hypothetical protein